MASSSVREYAILYVGGGRTVRGSVGGGNVMLNAGQHALDGPEHTGQLPLERISTTELDTTLIAKPDGLGGIEFSAGSSALEVFDEGVSLDTAVTSIDVTGVGVIATAVGHDVTLVIPGATTSGSLFFGPLLVNDPVIVTTTGEAVYVPLADADGQPIFIEYAAP